MKTLIKKQFIRNYKRNVYIDFLIILLLVCLGIIFAFVLNFDFFVYDESKTKTNSDILYHNLRFLFLTCVLTSLTAYPLIFFNSIFLGINISIGWHIHDFSIFIFKIKHIPIELLAWLFTLQASKELYRLVFYKKLNKNKLISFLILAILFYIIGAIIEPL